MREGDCGMPQGSCLGSLLYSISVNDLPFLIDDSTVAIFADDLTLYLVSNSITDFNTSLEKYLNLVYNWVVNNKLVFNTS